MTFHVVYYAKAAPTLPESRRILPSAPPCANKRRRAFHGKSSANPANVSIRARAFAQPGRAPRAAGQVPGQEERAEERAQESARSAGRPAGRGRQAAERRAGDDRGRARRARVER